MNSTYGKSANGLPATSRTKYDSKQLSRSIIGQLSSYQQLGARSFPNKRILRNNLCLPACKLLYLDKREKNFLLTDIISDIIICP